MSCTVTVSNMFLILPYYRKLSLHEVNVKYSKNVHGFKSPDGIFFEHQFVQFF